MNQNFSSQIFWFENHFLGNRYKTKIFIKNILVEKFLWMQIHFLGNRLEQKYFIKNFIFKIFMVAKSFPRK